MHPVVHRTEHFRATSPDADPSAVTRGGTAAGLLANSTIELSTNGRDAVTEAARLLPAGMPVYVPKLPGRSHADELPQLRLLHELGFKPVPHIAARDLGSARELEEFLTIVAGETGTDQVLVIGGDAAEPAGPFSDSAAVMASGLLEASGIRRVDVAGYPSGHPRISPEVLRNDMTRKVQLAQQRNLELTIVTQFSFLPEQITEYCAGVAQTAPGIAVRAGVPGPTSVKRLLHFARICGVSTSLRAINKLGLDTLKLVMHADTDQQFEELTRHSAAGGAGNLESATWLNSQRRLAAR
jgi:methylenetetrahydrofolate reductase (NADPH)